MEIKVKGILSYPNLFTPKKASPDAEPRYGAWVLLPPGDPQIAMIQRAYDTEKANGFPSGFPANGKECFLPAEKVVFATTGKTLVQRDPRMAGWYVLKTVARENDKPAVVDTSLQPVMDQGMVSAGMVAWVHGNLKTFNKTVNRGISCWLNGVMATGETGQLGLLGNEKSVEQMFGDVATSEPAPAPAPAAAPAPAPAAAPAPAPVTPAPAPVQHQMTEKANGVPYEQWIAQGWTDQMLIEQGYMLPPGGAPLAFQ